VKIRRRWRHYKFDKFGDVAVMTKWGNTMTTGPVSTFRTTPRNTDATSRNTVPPETQTAFNDQIANATQQQQLTSRRRERVDQPPSPTEEYHGEHLDARLQRLKDGLPGRLQVLHQDVDKSKEEVAIEHEADATEGEDVGVIGLSVSGNPKAIEEAQRARQEFECVNPDLATSGRVLTATGSAQQAGGVSNRPGSIREQIAHTRNTEELKQLIKFEIRNMTKGMATPADNLQSIIRRVTAYKPGDVSFAKLVRSQAEAMREGWKTDGRTHEIWDPLIASAKTGNWGEVKKVIHGQLVDLAKTHGTINDVKAHQYMLLSHQPADAKFDRAAFDRSVNEAIQKYLVDDPEEAARQVEIAYQGPGEPMERSLRASAKLGDLTDPTKADPLKAALIVKQVMPTIKRIIATDPSAWERLSYRTKSNSGGYLSSALFRNRFVNLSAVADSIVRSPEGKDTFETIAAAFQKRSNTVYAEDAVAAGAGTSLALGIVKKCLDAKDLVTANRIARDVETGVTKLKDSVRDSVHQLAETAWPLISPALSWNAFLGDPKGPKDQPFKAPAAFADEWMDSQKPLVLQVKAEANRVEDDGYKLWRAQRGIEEFLRTPKEEFAGLGNLEALRQQSTVHDEKTDPELSFAQALSSRAIIDALRAFNQDGLAKGELRPLSYTFGEFYWPARMTRNTGQNLAAAIGGDKPFSIGLSLYGVGTYIGGAANHLAKLRAKIAAHGWQRALIDDDGLRGHGGFITMYVLGLAIEGGHVAAQIASPLMGLKIGDPGWRGFVARAATSSTASGWGKLFLNHLRAFGWYNVAGTANYLIRGDWAKATALGFAATGTLAATYPATTRAVATAAGRFLQARRLLSAANVARLAGLSRFVPFWGNLATTLGALALAGIDDYRAYKLAHRTEPFNESYLVAAGVRRELAHELARNDSNGFSAVWRLLAYAEYTHTNPRQWLIWLDQMHQKDPKFVSKFVRDALLPIKPDENGKFPQKIGKERYEARLNPTYIGEVLVEFVPPAGKDDHVDPTSPQIWAHAVQTQALSLEGLRLWLEREAERSGFSPPK
jgi:hypothetical protein